MSPQLRQRLIGAAVLVAGAVIFIPMLLDEDALQNSFDYDRLNVRPPEPGTMSRFDSIDAQMLDRAERGAQGESPNQAIAAPASVAPQRPGPVITTPTAVDSNEATDKANATQSSSDKPVAANTPLPEVVPTQRSLSEPASRPTSSSPVAPPPARESEPEAWVVQLGVFRDDAAARALEQRVRAAGYKAYVDSLPSDNGTSYRVRVGPEPRRANAETTRAQLQQLLKLNGFVVPHF